MNGVVCEAEASMAGLTRRVGEPWTQYQRLGWCWDDWWCSKIGIIYLKGRVAEVVLHQVASGTVWCGPIFTGLSAMIIFHCWNCFVGFNGLSYDAWAKCPHFFASGTTFGGLGGPWEPPIWPKLAKMGIAGYSHPWRPQIGGTAWILVGSRWDTSRLMC